MSNRSPWTSRMALLGGVAAAACAVRVLSTTWRWAQLSPLAPVAVKRLARGPGRAPSWALVTGASEGIGRAIADELARLGFSVVLVSRSQSKLDAAARAVKLRHPAAQLRAVGADLACAHACAALVQQLAAEGIAPAVLVANVGGVDAAAPGAYAECSWHQVEHARLWNGESCYALVHAVLPGMLAAGRGAIVGISSLASRHGMWPVTYSAEKAKMNAFMASLDGELRGTGSGVTAQAMLLGQVMTPAFAKFANPALLHASPEEVEAGIPKPTLVGPSAEAAGRAVVRAIGRGGPVVTPYWSHALLEAVTMDGVLSLVLPGVEIRIANALGRRLRRAWGAKSGQGGTGGEGAAAPSSGALVAGAAT